MQRFKDSDIIIPILVSDVQSQAKANIDRYLTDRELQKIKDEYWSNSEVFEAIYAVIHCALDLLDQQKSPKS